MRTYKDSHSWAFCPHYWPELCSHKTRATMLLSTQVDEAVTALRRDMKIPGTSVAVVRDGKVIKATGYGLANVELNVPVTPETIFQAGSIGKQFTGNGNYDAGGGRQAHARRQHHEVFSRSAAVMEADHHPASADPHLRAAGRLGRDRGRTITPRAWSIFAATTPKTSCSNIYVKLQPKFQPGRSGNIATPAIRFLVF